MPAEFKSWEQRQAEKEAARKEVLAIEEAERLQREQALEEMLLEAAREKARGLPELIAVLNSNAARVGEILLAHSSSLTPTDQAVEIREGIRDYSSWGEFEYEWVPMISTLEVSRKRGLFINKKKVEWLEHSTGTGYVIMRKREDHYFLTIIEQSKTEDLELLTSHLVEATDMKVEVEEYHPPYTPNTPTGGWM